MPKIIAAGVGLPLIGTGATVTTSQPLLNLTQTWNNVATTFTGLKLNVTDTTSASGSLLMDLQVGAATKFNVSKAGVLTLTGATAVTLTPGAASLLTLNGGLTIANNLSLSAGNQILFGANARIVDSASGNLLISTSGTGTGFGLLQFGGTTSSFPALKRSTTNLEARLADDSTYAPFTAGNITAAGSSMFAINMLATGYIKTTATTVGALGSAATPGAGARRFVTDALGPTFGAAVVGGGAVSVPVYSDSVTWLVG